MKLRLRTLLVFVTLALLLATVAVIGVTSYTSGRDSAEGLADKILKQTADRVTDRIADELGVALAEAEFDKQRLGPNGTVDRGDQEALAAMFLDEIAAHPELTYLGYSNEADGNHLSAARDRDGMLALYRLTRGADGKLAYTQFGVDPIEHASRGIAAHADDKPENDPRTRPYYVAAVRAGAATWTETYPFLSTVGSPPVPGITRATPIYVGEKRDQLAGVLDADFDLVALSQFLAELPVGDHGIAFVVELRADGTRRVIAHPDPAKLGEGGASDPRVAALLPMIDPANSPGDGLVPVRFDAGGAAYIGNYRAFSTGTIGTDRGLHWVVAIVLPRSDILGPVDAQRTRTIWVTCGALAIAVVLAVLLAMQIGNAIRRLTRETEAIARFHLDAKPVDASNVVEVRQLSTAIEDMKRGLRSFRKFVPADLVRRLVESGDEAMQGGKRETITVHFSDIADFTTISEQLAPEQLVELLGEYLSLMSGTILEGGGTIDKYIGDAVMAFWNAPRPVADHALVACKAVLANRDALAARRPAWIAAGLPGLRCRVGLHTGEAVVGNIGSEARLDFTAIGDTVNFASRLEGINKTYGTEILLSESTYALVADRVIARPIDRVAVKGKTTGLAIFELIALADDPRAAELRAAAGRHAQALDHYFAQRWPEALALLGDDPAATLFKARIAAFQVAPPPADWDGVHRMTTK